MATKITLKLDPTDKILLKRKLQDNGPAQKFFSSEIARLSDPYVPKDTGTLKNTVIIKAKSITYPVPYAQTQYYKNKGNGLRGKQWVERMWADRGKEIVKSVSDYVGGK